MNYWLFKSEPDVFSIDDLKRTRKTLWDGVRNYQARNFLRDSIKNGDLVLFYHSNAEPTGIAGLAKVVREGYPDPTAFDPKDSHYDPKSKPASPTWIAVDIQFVKKSKEVLTLQALKQVKGLEKMALLQKGSRLSVQPVTAEEFQIVSRLAGF